MLGKVEQGAGAGRSVNGSDTGRGRSVVEEKSSVHEATTYLRRGLFFIHTAYMLKPFIPSLLYSQTLSFKSNECACCAKKEGRSLNKSLSTRTFLP